MRSRENPVRILVDENSLWLKKHIEFFLAAGIHFSFIGDENSPNYGSSDSEILNFCIENRIWVFTENGCDFKALLASDSILKKASENKVKIIVSKQKYVPNSKVIIAKLLQFIDGENTDSFTFVPLGKY